MKNKLIFFLLINTLISCTKNKTDLAKIEFIKEINFGKIKNGDTVYKTIKIKNTSNNVLKIRQVKTSCGCTVAKINDSLLEKNQIAEIKIKFNTDNVKKGRIRKSIIIDANTYPNFTVLYLNGIIE